MDGIGDHCTNSLSDLCERLRSERLLVASELENLHKLNEQVDAEQSTLAQLSWISRQQQIILSRLLNSHPSVRSENCCKLSALLESAHFIDGYHSIGGQHYNAVTSVLNLLLDSPESIAEILHSLDQTAKDGSVDGTPNDVLSPEIVSCVFSLLYGCCVFPADERFMLKVLSHLVRIQLATQSNPRLILRKGNTSFCRLYRLFSEGLFTAKIFLTAALHDPIMFLLSQDELFLDIDPAKSAIRFPSEERRRRFGDDENSLSYLQKLTVHRGIIESKLKAITTRFVQGITQAMTCFPKRLAWLVRYIYTVLTEQKKIKTEEATLICTDLIFTHLICPAITNPETLGVVSDTPITYIARFNLMQVGQILQTLALAPFEQPPSHLAYFYSHFDQLSVAQVVKTVLEKAEESLDDLFPSLNDEMQNSDQFVRRSFIGTVSELQCLHAVLRSSALDHLTDANVRRELRALIRRLPARFDFGIATDKLENEGKNLANAEHSESRNSSPSNRGTKLRNLAGRVHTAAQKGRLRVQSSLQDDLCEDFSEHCEAKIEVLKFPLGDDREMLGLCPEEKFMENNKQKGSFRKHKISDVSAEKRTRFVDTESIGLSDRTTEGGSDEEEEGGSLSSSLEANDDGEDISTLPDNFSDMLPISANVSGRESPSISGPPSVSGHDNSRPTNAGEQSCNSSIPVQGNGMEVPRAMPNLPSSIRRENTEGLEDKFGKFGLPQQEGRQKYRDETHSLVSDSWSTDVLPSDTEGFLTENKHDGNGTSAAVQVPNIPVLSPAVVEAGPNRHSSALAQQNSVTARRVPTASVGGLSTSALTTEDRSDTWSVDAIASDSEADPARNDDLLMIDEPDIIERTSTLSGNEGARMMSGESSGSLAVCASAASQARSRANRGSHSDNATSNDNHSHSRSFKKPTDASIFRDLTAVNAVNAATSGVPTGSAGRLRRQSSGSSFYSKSDVDSEFSKDLNDDVISSFIGDYTPSFRNSIGEIATPSSPAVSILANAGSFCNDDNESSANSIAQREDSMSPSKMYSRNDLSSKSGVDDPHDEPITIKSRAAEKKSDEERVKADYSDDDVRVKWGSSGAMPKFVAKSLDEQATPLVRSKGQPVGLKKNIFYGLQKVGETLKIRKDMAVSTMRQSLSQSSSINELSSSTSRGCSKKSSSQDVNALPRRLIESQSLNSLNVSSQRHAQTADAILDKYKGKSLPPLSDTGESKTQTTKDVGIENVQLSRPYYDSSNLINCRAFSDVKRKLRIVLSSVGSMPGLPDPSVFADDAFALTSARVTKSSNSKNVEKSESEHLVDFLHLLLAESINGQNKTLSAQIREVLRCLAVFDKRGQSCSFIFSIRKLLRTLRDEHRNRTAYLMYLQQSRLTLLQLRSYLQKLTSRLQREKSLTGECLTEVLVRFYLEKNDALVLRFMVDFQSSKVQDERMDVVERTLMILYDQMSQDSLWRFADPVRIAHAKKSLERSLMAQIYNYALYPNGEADQCRDSVFHKSLKKLSQTIVPDHPELRIPSRLHGECPWPSAQAEIVILNAYKSPRDKLACVVRCCETIQNLIVLASGRTVPSADDITPILVYVLIQANPPALLSNIQYVSSFYGNRMEGEEAYWWAQLTSAVQFIKTLLNKHF